MLREANENELRFWMLGKLIINIITYLNERLQEHLSRGSG